MQTETPEHHAAAQRRYGQTTEQRRLQLLKIVHTAAKNLGWKEFGLWEDIKLRYGGHESTADMEPHELQRIIDFAVSKGFVVRHNGKGQAQAQGGQAKKLRALWLTMNGLGIVDDPSEAALCRWASNSRSAAVTTSLALLSGEALDANIERLKQWQKRELMQGECYCPECGKTFRPSAKQANAFGYLTCLDGHDATHYKWRKLEK